MKKRKNLIEWCEMNKVVAIIRTSTDKQEVESQKQEVVSMILADGYSPAQIEIVGGAGASAIKLDEAYKANMDRVEELVKTGSVKAVYAWAIDRIGRNEEVLMKFKNLLISHKVQLVIKNPSLRLLNEDGTVNSGVEIAFSLFATMAKQEMENKKARFQRGKKRNAESGKFNGGTVPFGYELDENGYYIPHKENAEVVKLAFELMASNKYTVSGLTEELRARGVMFNDRLITYQYVVVLLKNTSYIGHRNKYAFEKKYPRLVSDELYNKVQEVLANNNSSKGKSTTHYYFGSLLIKCPECGRNYIASHGKKYLCSAHNSPSIRKTMGQKECNNDLMIGLTHLDGLLWSISLRLHREYMRGLNDQQKIDIAEQIKVLEQKKAESEKRLGEINERYDRLQDVYIDGRMSKAKYEEKASIIESDERKINNDILSYEEEIQRLNKVLNGDNISRWLDDVFKLTEIRTHSSEKEMYDLIHQYITKVEIERATIPTVSKIEGSIISDGKPSDPNFKLTGRKGVLITVHCYNGEKINVFYIPNFRYSVNKIFTIENETATPFEYEPIIRDGGFATTRSAILQRNIISALGDRLEQLNKEERLKWFNELLRLLPKYGASYSGNFDETGEEDLKEIKMAYHELHKVRNFPLTINSLLSVSKLFDVDEGIMETISQTITQ